MWEDGNVFQQMAQNMNLETERQTVKQLRAAIRAAMRAHATLTSVRLELERRSGVWREVACGALAGLPDVRGPASGGAR